MQFPVLFLTACILLCIHVCKKYNQNTRGVQKNNSLHEVGGGVVSFFFFLRFFLGWCPHFYLKKRFSWFYFQYFNLQITLKSTSVFNCAYANYLYICIAYIYVIYTLLMAELVKLTFLLTYVSKIKKFVFLRTYLSNFTNQSQFY